MAIARPGALAGLPAWLLASSLLSGSLLIGGCPGEERPDGPPQDAGIPCDCDPETETCIDDVCVSLGGATHCDAPVGAIALIDRRLYLPLYYEVNDYAEAACSRRGFAIEIIAVEGLDDMTPQAVREMLIGYRETRPGLEGVLFVGNVPMATFFMSRLDIPQVKYWPRYYEDLDLVPQKTIPDGTVLQDCASGRDAEGYPPNWPCLASDDLYQAPFTVPPHDFDDFDQGPHYGLEQWAAFLPVGYAYQPFNNHGDWAEQLRPFFYKALEYYQDPGAYCPNLYHVGNDLKMVAEFGAVWDAIGPEKIDYYAINTLGEDQCINNPACYLRAPLENYASLDDFLAYARTLPWMNEGWQSPQVFLSHMNNNPDFPRRVVWWNVHSQGNTSIISWNQARHSINAGRGGLVALLDGCMVGSYERPTAPLPLDNWDNPAVHNNILVSLVYGQSAFTAAVGSVPLRANFDQYQVILAALYSDGYLGRANHDRSDAQDRDQDTPWGWRLHQEILIGDPFVDGM